MLDHLHRCLTTWLAPVLCFTAEEAWAARFGDAESVHLQLFPDLPPEWRDDALAAKWETHPRDPPARIIVLEAMRAAGRKTARHFWPGSACRLPDADCLAVREGMGGDS